MRQIDKLLVQRPKAPEFADESAWLEHQKPRSNNLRN